MRWNGFLGLMLTFLLLLPSTIKAETLGGNPPDLATTLPATHPYLFFTPQTLEQVRAKKTIEPYRTWYNSLIGYSNGAVVYINNGTINYNNAWWDYTLFGDLGLAYQLETNATQKAVYAAALKTFISNIPTTLAGMSDQGNNNAAVNAALVYDAIADNPTFTAAETDKLETFIRLVAASQTYFLGDNWARVNPSSNHIHRGAGTVAFAGLALRDQDLLNTGLTHLYSAFSASLSNDGVWDHGNSYVYYGLQSFTPLALAYNRLFAINLYQTETPPVKQMFQALAMQRRPDSFFPNFNDSVYNQIDTRAFAHLLPNPELQLWNSGNSAYTSYEPQYLFFFHDNTITPQMPTQPATRFLEDKGMAMLRKDWTSDSSYFFLEGKMTPSLEGHNHHDQTNFTFFAKNAAMVIDPGYAGYTATHDWDPATQSCTIPVNLVSSLGHNVILADGSGPVDALGQYSCPLDYSGVCNDFGWFLGRGRYADDSLGLDKAGLTNHFTTNFFDTASLNINYAFKEWSTSGVFTGNCSLNRDQVTDVSINRTVLYPKQLGIGNEYAIIVDTVTAAIPHVYDWVLHGGSNRISGQGKQRQWLMETFDKLATNDKATIAVPNYQSDGVGSNDRELTFQITATSPLTLTEHEGLHYLVNENNRRQSTHTYIKATTAAVTNAKFLSLLYPRTVTGMTAPLITELSGTNNAVGLGLQVTEAGVSLDDKVITQPNTGITEISNLRTDAATAYVHKENEEIKMITMYRGTTMSEMEKLLIRATQPIKTLTLNYISSTQAEGHLITDQAIELTIYNAEGDSLGTKSFTIGETDFNFTQSPVPVEGDYDGDGDVDMMDLLTLVRNFNSHTIFDFNRLVQQL